ncbi:hypothetical protein [Niveibacterium umoris]|uniref:Uncharacterized protein n=1 Tax=Niveibacterium umoris TaxID=1193620 RepID=A0A840BN42_9RHOO|nr:hypothetical protein [Niveibacterium umoris]MBB4013082.1 hypothetical protein [Niveibacterium umoris]
MKQRHLFRHGQACAFLLALAVISSPELRAFVLVADYIGVEMLLLLGGLYFRSHSPVLQFAVYAAWRWSMRFGAGAIHAALRGARYVQLVGPVSQSAAELLCSGAAWRSAFGTFQPRRSFAHVAAR